MTAFSPSLVVTVECRLPLVFGYWVEEAEMMQERSTDMKAQADTWSGYLPLHQPERTFGLITPDVVNDLVRRAPPVSLGQRIARQKFLVQTPTLVLPLEPTIPPVKVAPPKRTTPPAQPAFTAPPYRRGMLGRIIPKIGRIIHAGLVKQAREVHAQAVAVWKLRCEEIGRENEAE